MAVFRKGVNLMPQLTEEEVEERAALSKTGVYAAILPLVATVIWILSLFIANYYKGEVTALDSTIQQKQNEIATYNSTREKQTELVLKIDELIDVVEKDFYPDKFFNDIQTTIDSTGGALADVYAYERDDEGTFNILGYAGTYLDLAKIMAAFNGKEEFDDVRIKSIYYSAEHDNVHFEILFNYADIEAES